MEFKTFNIVKYKNLKDIIDIYEFNKSKLFTPVYNYIEKLRGKISREEYLTLYNLCKDYKDKVLKVFARCGCVKVAKIPASYYFILKEDDEKVECVNYPYFDLPENIFEDIEN